MPFPEWLEPMAATLTQERFTGPDWIFERKFDGIRLLAYKRGSNVTLYSRNRLPQNNPPVAAAVAVLPVADAVLDGEVTWPGGRIAYHVFDVLWLDGRDAPAPRCARDPRASVHARCRSAAAARPLGPAGDRRPGVLHRMDGPRQTSPSAPDWRPLRQGRARRRAGDAVITHPDKILFPDDG